MKNSFWRHKIVRKKIENIIEMNSVIRIVFTLLVTGSVIFVCCDGKLRSKRAAPVCGSPTRQAGFIFGGSRSTRGEFPWLVALMFAGTSPPSLIGGGTLISDRHVVTGEVFICDDFATSFVIYFRCSCALCQAERRSILSAVPCWRDCSVWRFQPQQSAWAGKACIVTRANHRS